MSMSATTATSTSNSHGGEWRGINGLVHVIDARLARLSRLELVPEDHAKRERHYVRRLPVARVEDVREWDTGQVSDLFRRV